MEKRYIEYKKAKYPVYEINLVDVYKDQTQDFYTLVAGDELYNTLEADGLLYDNASHEAVSVDSQIFFYCGDEFFNSNPSYEELIEYIKKNI